MTIVTRKTFSPEFKMEAAQLVTEKGYSNKEAAELMNVSDTAIRTWVKQLKGELDGVPPKASPITPEQQKIRELERKIKRLEEDKVILKKATALLMSDSFDSFR